MRAISVFSLEAGTSTLGWRAWIALRTRVSMSAMGSLVIVLLLQFLPTGLGHAWNLAVQGELAEAQTANAELPQESARPSAAPAAVAVPAWQFGNTRLPLGLGRLGLPTDFFQFDVFRNLCGSGHLLLKSPQSPGATGQEACLTAGTAFPSGAAAPGPPHRCGR